MHKKEAQLSEVLAASNLDPSVLGVVSKKLDDVLDSKNGAIQDLQYELARVTKVHFLFYAHALCRPPLGAPRHFTRRTHTHIFQAHNDVVRVYESKLTEFGIPVEELGFRPLLTNTGTGPAGLVVA